MEQKLKCQKKSWNIPVSNMAKNTFNPIRRIVDEMKIVPNPDKAMIALSIGDPTIFGNLHPPPIMEEAVIKSLQTCKHNGYGASIGSEEARSAIAKYVTCPDAHVTAKDVILASGCSGALDLAISSLANPGQNILVPRPGFSIYRTLAESLGIEVRYYDLLPHHSWEVDLESLASQIDDQTAVMIVNNPSNPCGSVYHQQHLRDIVTVAEEYKIPIIADEIYEHFVFSGHKYYPLATQTADVPILACSGLTKRFIVPGWRLGWIVIYDKNELFSKEVRAGLVHLSQRILGPNSIIQGAVPRILAETPQSFFDGIVSFVESNARLCHDQLAQAPGLRPVMPQGAMYMMVGFDRGKFPQFTCDVDFTQTLVSEESVFCLPGQCFQYPYYFRIVLTVPREKMQEACKRIIEFCERHCKKKHETNENVVTNGNANHVTNGV